MKAGQSTNSKPAVRRAPGAVRDAIIAHLSKRRGECAVKEIRDAVASALGAEVAASSVRSYLNLNTPGTFERTGRGLYRMAR